MKHFLLLISIAALSTQLFAQAPPRINYQAVARNASGAELANQTISLRITFKDLTANGTPIYMETHSGITTNQFGLFTVSIGGGTPVSGTFNAINWANGAKFLKIEMDPNNGTSYLDMGTTQLLSVPYALYAAQSGSGSGAQSLNDLSDVNTAGVTVNQVLQWNGTSWVPATVSGTDSQILSISGNTLSISNGNSVILPTGSGADNWGTQTVVSNQTLTGNGTSGSPLAIAQQGASSGQALKWNGTNWAPANDVNTDNQTLTLTGNTLSISGGNSVTLPTGSDNQTLSLSGSTLSISNGNSVTLPTGTTYTAGTGISISGNVISNTGDNDNNPTNELQTLSVSGNSLSISNGNSVTLPTGTTYTAGTGISISGNVISNTGDNDNNPTNEIQTISISGNTVSLSLGGGSITLPGGGGLSGNGTNNYVARFTPNGTTLGNSIIQDNGTTIGVNNAPVGTDRMILNSGTISGLKIISTNTTSGLYALNASITNGADAMNAYIGYVGSVGFGALTATNPIIYGTSSTGVAPSILGINSGTNTSASNIGLSSNWHGGFFSTTDSDASGVVGSGGYGLYQGSSANGAGITGTYNGTVDMGAGVLGFNNRLTGTLNIGVEGQYNTAAFGIGVSGIGWNGSYPVGNNDIGVWGSAGNNMNYAIYGSGNFAIVNGTKSASVGTTKGNQLLYCIESPEVWFEDFGTGKLVNGEIEIKLDELFLETVVIDDEHPMIVTLTPMGNCNGLYVEPGTTSFKVKELMNGSSNVSFSYRITCKRLNFQDHRFGADLTWGDGDTRGNYHYITPTPINYQEAKNLQMLKKQQETKISPKLQSLMQSSSMTKPTR